jgi:hypothetical protein
LIVLQPSNGQSSEGDCRKPKGNYTGERVKLLRPETYRCIVRLLAEPREHVSYREICRQCHVTDDTVKAIEQREAVPIAARKQTLMVQAARIAQLAADRVEDQIGAAPFPQSVVIFGVMTDKLLALSGEPSLTIHHEHTHTHQHELVAALHAQWSASSNELKRALSKSWRFRLKRVTAARKRRAKRRLNCTSLDEYLTDRGSFRAFSCESLRVR